MNLIKPALAKRLVELESKAEMLNSKPVEIDYEVISRRNRRQRKVLNAVYDSEGLDGLRARHDAALARNRHRVPKWLAGHRQATTYSVFLKDIRFNLERMEAFIEFWTERRESLKNDPSYAPSQALDRALDAARRGDLRGYQAASSDAVYGR